MGMKTARSQQAGAIEYNETYREKTQRERALRKKKRKARRYAFFITVFCMVLALSAVSMMMRIEMTKLTDEVSTKQQKIVDLDSEYTTLKAEEGTSMTLEEVEDYAKNQLGLVSLDRSQEEYLAVEKPDQVEVDKGSSGMDKLVSNFVRSFNAVLSFLR